METLRNFFIRSDYLARRLTGLAGSSRRVLGLHDIPDRAIFRDRMSLLKERFHVVSLAALLNSSSDADCVALTFDDGYADWIENAVPVLEEMDLPATFFVCSGYVGLSGQDQDDFCAARLLRGQTLQPLSRQGLTDLSQGDGFEIGSHTINHCNLAEIADPDTGMTEIRGDKHTLEDLTGKPIRYFAYPFGTWRHFSPQAERWVSEAGFEAAFLAEPGPVRQETMPYRIRRDLIDPAENPEIWVARVNGGYDRLYRARESFSFKG